MTRLKLNIFGKNYPSHHTPSGAHNLSIIGESEFDHLLKVESAKFPQCKDGFFYFIINHLWNTLGCMSILPHPHLTQMFIQCFLTTIDDPCLNQLLSWCLQNTDSLNLSLFLLELAFVYKEPNKPPLEYITMPWFLLTICCELLKFNVSFIIIILFWCSKCPRFAQWEPIRAAPFLTCPHQFLNTSLLSGTK